MLQLEPNLTQVEPNRKKKMKCDKKGKGNTLANKINKKCVPQKEVVAVLRKSYSALCLLQVQAQEERNEICKLLTLHLCLSGGPNLRR